MVEMWLAFFLLQLCAGALGEVHSMRPVVQNQLTVKVVKISNSKLLSVDDNGVVTAFGDLSDPDICLIFHQPENEKVQLESKAHSGRFVGVTEDGQIIARDSNSGDYQTFKFSSPSNTKLVVDRDDDVCKLEFEEDGTALNACEDNGIDDTFNVVQIIC